MPAEAAPWTPLALALREALELRVLAARSDGEIKGRPITYTIHNGRMRWHRKDQFNEDMTQLDDEKTIARVAFRMHLPFLERIDRILALAPSADWNERTPDGDTLLQLLVDIDHYQFQRILRTIPDLPSRRRTRTAAELWEALACEQVERAIALAPLIQDLDTRDATGRAPLHAAIAFGEPRLVAALLCAGADGSLRTPRGETALHLLAFGVGTFSDVDAPRVAVALRGCGADTNVVSADGATAAGIARAAARQALADAIEPSLPPAPPTVDDGIRRPREDILRELPTNPDRYIRLRKALQAKVQPTAGNKKARTEVEADTGAATLLRTLEAAGIELPEPRTGEVRATYAALPASLRRRWLREAVMRPLVDAAVAAGPLDPIEQELVATVRRWLDGDDGVVDALAAAPDVFEWSRSYAGRPWRHPTGGLAKRARKAVQGDGFEAVPDAGMTDCADSLVSMIQWRAAQGEPLVVPPAPAAAAPAKAKKVNPTEVLSQSMVRIEPGAYETATARVRITRPFLVGATPITQARFEGIMGFNRSAKKGKLRPVTVVSWYHAVEFCNRLSAAEGLEPAYELENYYEGSHFRVFGSLKFDAKWRPEATGYRLLTEAEWTHIARGGGTPCAKVDRREVNVGSDAPNGLGVYDLPGEPGEWVWDWFGDAASGDLVDPTGPTTGDGRRVMGGDGPVAAWRSAPESNGDYMTIRVARSIL